jgi:DNA-directed RNA polymerase
MQHYAALGGDVRGAKAVNLENGDRPADIYSGVADIVNKVIADDRATGHTVMTTVYGELSSGRPRHWTNGELTSCRCYFHRRS